MRQINLEMADRSSRLIRQRGLRHTRCLFLVLLALLFTACGKNSGARADANHAVSATSGVADALAAGIEKENAAAPGTSGVTEQAEGMTESSAGAESSAADGPVSAGDVLPGHGAATERRIPGTDDLKSDVDVDLTMLSSTMVFSEVYNIMVLPQDYMGKTIRMRGITAIYTDSGTGQKYYSCIVQDATACCAQGIEFHLTDESQYPAEGEEVTVRGTFDTYGENGYQYAVLSNAVVE